MLTAPTLAQFATFTGRDQASLPAFATEALGQSTLLFYVNTRLEDYPDDPALASLAAYAIMEMADQIMLAQPYAATMNSPFQSETIGSYSYSKGRPAKKAETGEMTGLRWWDLAIDALASADRSIVDSGSISAFDRNVTYADDDGHRHVFTPSDVAERSRTFLG